MTATSELNAPTGPQPRPKRRRRVSFFGVLGELLITVGVLILLFVAWQLWWTDIMAKQAYNEQRTELQQKWGLADQISGPPKPVDPKYGEAFGLIYIPALGDKAWGIPVVEGTEREPLMKGMGHHPGTAVPGELGNFTVAGHRTTYGAPLHNIETLKPGDEVIIETKHGWYVYELDSEEIIEAWEGWVLDPVPGLPADEEPQEALLTLYSCHPKFSAAQRYVWFGELIDEYPKSAGTPPAIEARDAA
ncbi:class E sortase [Candidatus Nanopelagicales bacterium]|nr:class E sortase [Candidatus Nanopelagicales bacterium]